MGSDAQVIRFHLDFRSMVRVKAKDLRGKTKENLLKTLDEQKTELAGLQVCNQSFESVNDAKRILKT